MTRGDVRTDRDPSAEGIEARITETLEAARKGGRDAVRYVAPSPEELARFRAWLTGAIDALDAGQQPVAAPPGWTFDLAGDLMIVREAPDAKRGGGAYVFRKNAARGSLAVSAPHTFWDSGTLPIAIAVFIEGRARALSINTIHRYAELMKTRGGPIATDDEERNDSPCDLAHREDTFFQVVHEELLRRGAASVQLHGFRDEQVPGADVVFSASNTTTDAATRADALKKATARAIAAYPRDTKKLGGTTNVQARASARAGAAFFHVEMSKSTRAALVESAEQRRAFASSLVAAVSAPRISDR